VGKTKYITTKSLTVRSDNGSTADALISLSSDANFQSFGLKGSGARQYLQLNSGATLPGRNEIQVAENATIDLQGGTLETVRWIDILENGTLVGNGHMKGQLYNNGLVAPGNSPALVAIEGD
jgi:hypothetical protein